MRSLALLPLALLLGCASASDAGAYRTLGIIAGFHDDDPRITVQAAGRTVTATVVTYGGCCDQAAETDVEVSGLSAVVTPYDRRGRCTQKCARMFEHRSTFSFAQAGTARVAVRGIDVSSRSSGDPLAGDTIAVEREVVIE